MARGWESKSIEAQQEEAARGKSTARPLTEEERSRAERRRTLELARTRFANDLSRATVAAHRHMLQQTLEAIDTQLRELKQP